jgi:hypothetical protein
MFKWHFYSWLAASSLHYMQLALCHLHFFHGLQHGPPYAPSQHAIHAQAWRL